MNDQQREPKPSRDATLCAQYFAKHRAEYHRADIGPARMESLVWREPRTNINRIDYYCDGGRLFVAGDLGDAIYITGAKDLSWWTRCDLDYFASKCDASEHGRGYKTWDGDVARARLDEEIARMRADDEEVDDLDVLVARDALSDGRGAWDAWMRESASELFGHDWWDFVPNFGAVVAQRCALHLAGLKAAMTQVRATEAAAASVVLAVDPSRSTPEKTEALA
jgi:hypothetical protein